LTKEILTIEQRVAAFAALGKRMREPDSRFEKMITDAHLYNPWYTAENVRNAFTAIGNNLSESTLTSWIAPYQHYFAGDSTQTAGLILAGNIPLVGFHDILCVLIAGYQVQVKISSDDKKLTPAILETLLEIEPRFSSKINQVERLQHFDAVIATGSNNSSRYFDYYFRDVPHIIRKNRNSIAILDGNESDEDLQRLGHDIFDYFGLGCRNVSKLYVPENYDFTRFFKGIQSFETIGNHYKYHNNYDYNKSIYLINGDHHLDNGFLLVKKDHGLSSPLAVVHYDYYNDAATLRQEISALTSKLQCVVTRNSGPDTDLPLVPFGKSQQPALDDYADGINTLAFLASYI
jgi:hypothetical protein